MPNVGVNRQHRECIGDILYFRKMRNLVLFMLAVSSSLFCLAQTSYSSKQHGFPKRGHVVLKDLPILGVSIKTQESFNAPLKRLDAIKPNETHHPNPAQSSKKKSPDPSLIEGFLGQAPSGTPLDNNLAVSKDGLVFSCANTTVRVLDSTGKFLFSRSLAALANELGSLTRTFDPHTFYDFERDRFILVFLNGSDHANTEVIVGFSETNDPREGWNFYSIPGNTSSNEWWSDYPFIGISKEALFISVLLWQDGESGWDTDAIDENIWQIDLEKGFAGDSLRVKQYNALKYAGRQLWNTRPISGVLESYGPEFFLLGNRPKDASNDTLFLIRIKGNWDAQPDEVSIEVVKANQAYGLQPNVTQLGGKKLRTNYCDIQKGYYLNESIYFCANSIDFSTGRPGIYVGKIEGLNGTPVAKTQIFGVDSLDLNYPSIAYAGAGWPDESAVVMCLHNSQNSYPGTSVFSMGRDFTPSNLVRAKEGLGMMRVLVSDSLERWGDYTGIQRSYSQLGKVWFAGSYGLASGGSQTWIAAVGNEDPMLSVSPLDINDSRVYPNPGAKFTLEFELIEDTEIQVLLFDVKGQEVFSKFQNLHAGKQQLDFLPGASSGNYILLVKSKKSEILLREKLFVN